MQSTEYIPSYLSREAQTSCDSAHCGRHQVIQIPVCGRGQLERSKADVVQSLVIDAEGLIRILHQLVN